MLPCARDRWVALTVCVLLAVFQGAACRSSSSDGSNRQPPAETGPLTQTPSATDASADGRPRIVLLGDSLTAGLGLVETQAYPALLQQMMERDGYDFEVDNAGVSGDTSAGGLRRLDWALQGNARVLILALGANDGLRGLSVADMKNNLTRIIERAQERNVMVILAGMEAPPNYGQDYTAAFRQAFRDLAREHHTLFIPFLLDKVAGQPDLNQADGIHPNAAGARIVADTVWNVLRPALDQLSMS